MATAPFGPSNEQVEAAKATLQRFIVEAFTLLGFGIAITMLRTYSRIKTLGFSKLKFDDLFAWLAMIFVAAETAIAYTLGHELHGIGNSNMAPEQRAQITPGSDEYRMRILGSQLPLAAWATYFTALWCLKGALLYYYSLLTVLVPAPAWQSYFSSLLPAPQTTDSAFTLGGARPWI
jgi:hypothetical protein